MILGFKQKCLSFLTSYWSSIPLRKPTCQVARCVTTERWVVEGGNGQLTKWKFWTMSFQTAKYFVRIVASILNKNKPPLKTNNGNDNLARTFNVLVHQSKIQSKNVSQELVHTDFTDCPKLGKILMLMLFMLTSLFFPLIISETSSVVFISLNRHLDMPMKI